MTLEEAIKHAEEVADLCEYEASKYDMSDSYESYVACQEGKCAEEHRQLAEWLKDYQRLLKAIDDIIAEFWCYESSMIVNGREYIGIADAVEIVEKHTGKELE